MLNPHGHDEEDMLRLGAPMSEAEYHQLNNHSPFRYEYIDGIAWRREAPQAQAGGTVGHSMISVNLTYHLRSHFFAGTPCVVLNSDIQFAVGTRPNGNRDYYYPEIAITCDRQDTNPSNTYIEHPTLVVEVLSKSTEYVDLHKKLAMYQRCPSIREILLIDQYKVRVAVYSRHSDDTWPKEPMVYEYLDDVYESRAFDDLAISLQHIYQGVLAKDVTNRGDQNNEAT